MGCFKGRGSINVKDIAIKDISKKGKKMDQES